MFCKNCNKEIYIDTNVCPYCGRTLVTSPKKTVNGLGIAGFVVSLLSLWFGTYFCIAPIVGIILSTVALIEHEKHSLNGLAIAGLVIGIVSLVIWGLVWIIAGAMIAAILG